MKGKIHGTANKMSCCQCHESWPSGHPRTSFIQEISAIHFKYHAQQYLAPLSLPHPRSVSVSHSLTHTHTHTHTPFTPHNEHCKLAEVLQEVCISLVSFSFHLEKGAALKELVYTWNSHICARTRTHTHTNTCIHHGFALSICADVAMVTWLPWCQMSALALAPPPGAVVSKSSVLGVALTQRAPTWALIIHLRLYQPAGWLAVSQSPLPQLDAHEHDRVDGIVCGQKLWQLWQQDK